MCLCGSDHIVPGVHFKKIMKTHLIISGDKSDLNLKNLRVILPHSKADRESTQIHLLDTLKRRQKHYLILDWLGCTIIWTYLRVGLDELSDGGWVGRAVIYKHQGWCFDSWTRPWTSHPFLQTNLIYIVVLQNQNADQVLASVMKSLILQFDNKSFIIWKSSWSLLSTESLFVQLF